MAKIYYHYPKGLFEHVIAPGAFDYFHKGHRFFLRVLKRISRKVTVLLVKHRPKPGTFFTPAEEEFAIPIDKRRELIEDFLAKNRIRGKVEVVDCYLGDSKALWEPDFDAWAISAEAISRPEWMIRIYEHFNQEREKRGLKKVKIVIVPVLCDDKGIRYSASRLKRKEPEHPRVLHIRRENNLVIVKHHDEELKFTLNEFREMVAYFLRYYEDGKTNLKVNVEPPKKRDAYFRPPPGIPSKYARLWAHRRELYDYAKENKTLPIIFSPFRLWSAAKGDWEPLLKRDDVVIVGCPR